MGSPHEEEDIVVPLHLERVGARGQGLRGRSTTLVAAGLVAFVAFAIGLSTISGDHGPTRLPPLFIADATASPPPIDASSSSQASPGAVPSRVSLATPLPTIEITGSEVPTERRLVNGDGLELLDLATGSLTRPSPPLYDALLPVGADQLVCACVSGGPAGPGQSVPPTLRFGRFDLTGQALVQRPVLSFDGVVPVPNQSDGFSVATALSGDRRNLYVLTVVRRPPAWSVDLNVIDVDSGAILGGRTLGRFPVDVEGPHPVATPEPDPNGPPPDGAYAWASFITPAPDGRTVFVSVQTTEWRNGNGTNRYREWMVPIRDQLPGWPIRLPADATLAPDDWCVDAPWFIDPSTAVAVCADGRQMGASPFYVRRLATDGTSAANIAIDGLQTTDGYLAATVDRRSGAVIAWDPIGHTIARVDPYDASVAVSSVPAEMRPAGPSFDRSRIVAWPALVLSQDGQRAYAIGAGPREASTGVWVFDAKTLALLDHWEPRAVLNSIAISADGRFVYATGAPQVDVDGNQNALWQASVTVYDAASGQEQRLYGGLSSDAWLTFPNWR
ncbi:MAG TPA: hypothetical protein VF494_09420 [Candidatus Limnocylindrales bacterium]